MKIIIGFSRSKSVFKIGSLAIQLAEKRKFSHAYFRYECPFTNLDIVSQASHGYVNEIEYSIFKEDNVVVEEYELQISNVEFQVLLLYLRSSLGKKYSKLTIFVISILKLLSIKKQIYIDGDQKDICSEYIARGAKIISYITNLPTVLDTYTPSDLNTCIKSIYHIHKDKIRRLV